jgi:hypothetical protein
VVTPIDHADSEQQNSIISQPLRTAPCWFLPVEELKSGRSASFPEQFPVTNPASSGRIKADFLIIYPFDIFRLAIPQRNCGEYRSLVQKQMRINLSFQPFVHHAILKL